MKILMVTPYFYPSIGGVQNYVLNISNGLKKKYRCEVVIVTTTNHKQSEIIEVQGFKVYRMPYWIKLSNTPINPLWYFSISKIIKQEKPDIINAHTPVPFISDMAARAKGKSKFILTYHNDLSKSNYILSMFAKLYYLLLGNKTLFMSDKIITTSTLYADKSVYLRNFKDKLEVVSPGVDLTTFNVKNVHPVIKNKYSKNKNILFVGSLDKTHNHKGLEFLIESMADLKFKMEKVKLLVIGEGDNKAFFQSMAEKLNLNDSIDFLGKVDSKFLPSFYNISDVLVLPSINDSEGFGMVLLEAGACNKPVIGTYAGGMPYLIKNGFNGYLAKPKDVNSLSKCILKILNDHKVAKVLGENGYKKVKEKFTWDIASKNSIEVFR